MEELKSAMSDHVDLVSDLFERFSAELRRGFRPAYENFVGFFHAIDWKEPWLICLMFFHTSFLLIAIISRKNMNFQMCLSFLAFSSVYLAERINSFLAKHWENFASQNYFDPHGIFISALWSGPLLLITMVIVGPAGSGSLCRCAKGGVLEMFSPTLASERAAGLVKPLYLGIHSRGEHAYHVVPAYCPMEKGRT